MYDIEQLRRDEFPHSAEFAYLNHAGIAPLPQRTKRETQQAIERLSNNPTDFFGKYASPAFEALYASIARHINAASPGEIVAATSTSAALNAIAQAVEGQPGDNILFCDLEFPSNAYPWMSLARDGVEARRVPSDNGGLTLARVEQYADGHTRAVAVSAVQFFTGHRADLTAIGRFCRQNNILFIVDAIQAIGHMTFDVQAMNIDVLATGGMKSLMALPGTGFLYVREAVAEATRPRLIHGNSTVDYIHWLAYDLTMQPGAGRFASGTPNVAGLLSIAPSLKLIAELGPDNIDAHTTALTRYTGEALKREGYEIITPLDAAGPILTFRSRYDSETTDRLVSYLEQNRVVVCKHLDAGTDAYIRVSFHCYNIAEEVDRFMEALQGFVN